MDTKRQSFLTAVLGTDGASMLIKAVEKYPVLAHMLVPRTILGWIQSASFYEGPLPGNEASVSFEKTEAGFTGEVAMGTDDVYKFEGVNLFHLAGAVAVALGVEEMTSEGLRDLDIERLGKTIDALAKVKRVNDELEKKSPPGKFKDLPEELKAKGYSADSAFAIAWAQHNKEGAKKSELCARCSAGDDLETHDFVHEGAKEDLGKAAGTGVPAAPTPPTPPAAPIAAAPKASKPAVAPKTPKPQTMQLTRSEAEHKCPACHGVQFKDGQFVGCLCFRAFGKAIKVVAAQDDGLTIEMDMRILDADDVATFREALGR